MKLISLATSSSFFSVGLSFLPFFLPLFPFLLFLLSFLFFDFFMLCSFLCLFSSPLLLLLPLLLIPLLLGLLFGLSLFFFQPGSLPFPFFLFPSDFLPAFFFLLLFFLFHPSFSLFCSQFDLPGILLGSLFLSLGFLFRLLSLVGSSFLPFFLPLFPFLLF